MLKLAAFLTLLFLALPAEAQTYSYYEYDALGRLVRVEDQTGSFVPDLTSRVRYEYDITDNRVKVKQGASMPSAQPDALAAITVVFNGSVYSYVTDKDVLGNDQDADLPSDTKTIVSVHGGDIASYVEIIGGAYLEVDRYNMLPDTPSGSPYTFYYTMKDSDNQTSDALVTFEKTTFTCDSSDPWCLF